MLIDLILAVLFIVIITGIICLFSDGGFSESALIGIMILLLASMRLDTIRIVNTSPILSIIMTAIVISIVAVFGSMLVRKVSF